MKLHKLVCRVLVPASLVLGACASQPKPVTEDISPKQPVVKTDAEINLTELLQLARLTAYPNEKKQESLKIDHIEAGSAWNKIGLENGDVIVRVGDKALNSREHFLALVRAVVNPGTERLEVLRQKGKKKERLYLPLDAK